MELRGGLEVSMQAMTGYADPEADAARQEARATSEATRPLVVAGDGWIRAE